MGKKLSGSASAIYRNRDEIINTLRTCVDSILKDYPVVVRAVLFGSIARGDYGLYSDADILIIITESKYERFFDRIPEFLDYFSSSAVPVDIFPYTIEEIKRMKNNDNFLINRALKEGIVLGEASPGKEE
jgi:predicted nucleotidyltransferase